MIWNVDTLHFSVIFHAQTSLTVGGPKKNEEIIFIIHSIEESITIYSVHNYYTSFPPSISHLTFLLFLSISPPAAPPHHSIPRSKSPSNLPDSIASRPDIRDLKSTSRLELRRRLVSPILHLTMPSPPRITRSTATTS